MNLTGLKRLSILGWYGLSTLAAAQAVAGVAASPAEREVRINTFMEETLLIVKKFRESTTTFVANASLVQRAAGLTRYVSSDCRIEYTYPDYLLMDVKGRYPYSVLVSNSQVVTTFPESGERDTRALGAGETIFDHFLGIALVNDYRRYDFSFKAEKDLYILTIMLRPAARRALSANLVANLHKTVQRTIWVKPRTDQIVKTHFITLGGNDVTLTYRDQWINGAVPQL